MNAFEEIRKRFSEIIEILSHYTDEWNQGLRTGYESSSNIVSEVEAEYAKSASVLPWISIEEQEEPEEDGNYLVTACLYNDPDKTKTEIVSFCGEWNIGNNWNIVAWCPQRIEEYKPKDKTKDTFLSR